MTAWGWTTAETERRNFGQDQVSSDKDRGKRRERDVQEESNDTSEGWSSESAEDLAGSETEEDGMTAGGVE